MTLREALLEARGRPEDQLYLAKRVMLVIMSIGAAMATVDLCRAGDDTFHQLAAVHCAVLSGANIAQVWMIRVR